MTLLQWPAPKEEICHSESPDDLLQIAGSRALSLPSKVSECLIAFQRRKRIFLTFRKILQRKRWWAHNSYWTNPKSDEYLEETGCTQKAYNQMLFSTDREKDGGTFRWQEYLLQYGGQGKRCDVEIHCFLHIVWQLSVTKVWWQWTRIRKIIQTTYVNALDLLIGVQLPKRQWHLYQAA